MEGEKKKGQRSKTTIFCLLWNTLNLCNDWNTLQSIFFVIDTFLMHSCRR